jgi:hypothetical protein
MLPLQSIPTEIIRKTFEPTRGFILALDVALATKDRPLRHLAGETMSPLSPAKTAELAVDFDPLFQVFVDLFGYDLALLRAGDGDCGVEGHDWNLFGRPGRVPLVIRWRMPAGAEAILAIGDHPEGMADLYLAGVANRAMAPHLAKAFAAMRELPAVNGEDLIDVPAGNVLQKLVTPYTLMHSFTAGVAFAGDKDGLTPLAEAEMDQLRFSCVIGGRANHRVAGNLPVARSRELLAGFTPGTRALTLTPEGRFALTFGPEEPIPATVIAALHANSVNDAERTMGLILQESFRRQAERVQAYLQNEGLDVTPGSLEEAERASALLDAMRKFEELADNARLHLKVTFSEDFKSTPAKTLLGTRPLPGLRGGHVMNSPDMLQQGLFQAFRQTADRLIDGGRPRQLNARMIVSADKEQDRDREALRHRFETLASPYSTLVRGLPMRVTQTSFVWREDEDEGLACDYVFDPTHRELHFTALYKAKV